MCPRLRAFIPALAASWAAWLTPAPASAQQQPRQQQQQQQPQSTTPEQAVVDALRADPLILPYPIVVTRGKSGEIVLSGKVGTRAVHDRVVRTVIDLGLVPHDELTIDTAEAHRVALEQTQVAPPVPGAPYYVYPEPLFGRLDEPFLGMEPPALSYPAGAPRSAESAPLRYGIGSVPATAPPADGLLRRAGSPVQGRIRLTVDEYGQVFLSGDVASERDKREIEQAAMSAPGVVRVASELRVVDRSTPPPPPQPVDGPANPSPRPVPEPDRAVPPPPPPAAEEVKDAAPKPASAPPATLDDRLEQAIQRRPALANLGIEVRAKGDAATLSGKVPSAYEAMLAHRAVEKTPGVGRVDDRLEFPLPDENNANPLKTKARPDDLEPYLLFHVRRHVGDSAHVDRLNVRGDLVQVQGTIPAHETPERIEAMLRSIPLLRDFQIDADFAVD